MCECEHEDHFGPVDNADYGSKDHGYAKATADTVVETTRGSIPVCWACANEHVEEPENG